MKTKEFDRVFFVGIGGIGMSALARYFVQNSYDVAGYDRVESVVSKSLENLGVSIFYSDEIRLLENKWKNNSKVLVVYTPAIKESNLLRFFQLNEFRIQKRSEVLASIFNQKIGLAVAGTHGKTTTSAILTHIFKTAKMASAGFVGGVLKNYDSNYVSEGEPKYVIAEADEFDHSFLKLKPNMAVITAIDPDHLDIYESQEKFEEAFYEFSYGLDKDGFLLLANTIKIDRKLSINHKTYGIEGSADFRAKNLAPKNSGYRFDVYFDNEMIWKDVSLGISGLINVNNALAATVIAYKCGISEKSIRDGLSSFKGIRRRFDIHFDNGKIAFVDDYAHHPEEIRALLQGLKHKFGQRRLVAIFQPHLFSRTKDFATEFAKQLSIFDKQIILPIYPARELPIEGVSSKMIFDKIVSKDKFLIDKEKVARHIEMEKQPCVFVTIGAGDIDRQIDNWVELVKARAL